MLSAQKQKVKVSVKAKQSPAGEAPPPPPSTYEELKSDLETQIVDLQTGISDLEGTKSEKESEAQTAVEERITQKEQLGAVMEKIKAAEPGCDFIAVNFEIRTKNRQTEIDGLVKAKAILQGADFAFVQTKPKTQLAVRRHS